MPRLAAHFEVVRRLKQFTMAKKSTNKPTVEERATAIASAMVESSLNALSNQVQNKPDPWTKVLTIANVFLTVFTFAYVLLTFNMVSEMKQQNELARRNLQESLRPHLLMKLDSIKYHLRPSGGQPANTLSAQVVIQNNGNTPAEIQFTSLDAFPYSRLEANARDSILSSPLDSTSISEETGSISKYIPPHGSLSFIAVIQDISGRIRHDRTFYIHYMIIFSDAFGSLRDVYSVTRCDIDYAKREIGAYPPAYSFHDYTESEKANILHKSEVVLGR